MCVLNSLIFSIFNILPVFVLRIQYNYWQTHILGGYVDYTNGLVSLTH